MMMEKFRHRNVKQETERLGHLQEDEILQARELKILDSKQTLQRDRRINQIALARIKANEDGCSANAI